VSWRRPRPGLLIPAVSGWGLFWLFLWLLTPEPLFLTGNSTVLEDAQGVLLSAKTAEDGHWRFPPLESVPPRIKAAAMTFEDEGFERHFGFSFPSLIRAFLTNLEAGRVTSGGSTLTMQIVRLSRNNPPRTLWEKAWELLRAVSLEWHYSKDEILGLYLEHAPMGGNVVGIEAASWRYFGRNPGNLGWAESAMLAVLPNSPSLIRLDRNTDELMAKRNRLLEKLYQRGHFTHDDLELLKKEPLPFAPKPLPRFAPHYLETWSQKYGQGGRLQSTLRLDLQREAVRALERRLEFLAGDEVHNMAAIIRETASGDILAYVGNGPDSPEPSLERRVDLIQAPRSTGSLLKPFLYAFAVDSGIIAPRQLLPDIPLRWGNFYPENHNKQYEGAVPADLALARSRNIPAVWLLQKVGLNRFYDKLKEWGMTTLFRPAELYGLPLIIGGGEATMFELSSMFAGLARTAMPADQAGAFPLPGLSRGAAWLTLRALSLTIRPGEDRAWTLYADGRKIAWKTGTSQGWRDAWAVGMTPEYTIMTWAGNASGEGRPSLEGTMAAAPLLFDLFRLAGDTGWFETPVGALEKRQVSTDSGYTAGVETPRVVEELFPAGGPATPLDPYSRLVHLDPLGRVSDSRFSAASELTPRKWFVLPPTMEWYYKTHHAEYQPLPPLHPEILKAQEGRVSIVYPQDNTRIFIPVELDGTPGKLVVQAVNSFKGILFWHLDGDYIGQTESPHQMEIRPEQGPHTLTVVNESGDSVSRTYRILSRQ